MPDDAPGRASARGPALSLSAPARVRRGEPVPVAVRVSNTGTHPLELYLRGRSPTLDLVVRDTRGGIVWRRLQGEVIPAIVHVLVLQPGASFELRAGWDQTTAAGTPAPPGVYRLRGELLIDHRDPLETNPVSVEVTPEEPIPRPGGT
jgi:hypothetical protein